MEKATLKGHTCQKNDKTCSPSSWTFLHEFPDVTGWKHLRKISHPGQLVQAVNNIVPAKTTNNLRGNDNLLRTF
jgi:hypothetical protein